MAKGNIVLYDNKGNFVQSRHYYTKKYREQITEKWRHIYGKKFYGMYYHICPKELKPLGEEIKRLLREGGKVNDVAKQMNVVRGTVLYYQKKIA